jgi:hypothetical protein
VGLPGASRRLWVSEGGLGTKLHAVWEELTSGSQPREQGLSRSAAG